MRRDVAVEAPRPVAGAAVGPALAHVGDGPAETPASAEAPVRYAFRCFRRHPHDPHREPSRGDQGAFDCPGQPSAEEFGRLLAEAFGP